MKDTREYYKQQAGEWLVQLNSPEYIRKALNRFDEEERKAVEHMQQKTKGALLGAMCNVLIEDNAQQVISKETGCKSMLKNKKLEELKDMYKLFQKVESTLKYILEEMSPYIEERGKSIIDDDELKKDPVKFTKRLLDLKHEMDQMVRECFNDDPKFN